MMEILKLQPRAAAAILFLLASLASPAGMAGEGRIDASNGDVYFNVHFRFPPTNQQKADVRAAIDLMSFGMCDATDGQMRTKRVTFSQGQPTEDQGDFWIHALPGRTSLSFFFSGANLGNLGSHVNMFSDAIFMPDVYLHEFGHHAWGLGDEYDEQNRFGGPCGIGPGFDGAVDEQNHSIMQQSGSAQCVGGANNGNRCLRNADCPAAGGGAAGTCQLVLMSELSIPANADPLQGDGNNCPAVAAPATMCPDNNYCMRAWNSTTNRYEQTQQSEIHSDDSDWETLDENYPFVTPPAGLPVAAAPATCFRPVEYVDNVEGSDQVLLILDKSGSMSWSSNPDDEEVCGNGVDDDVDGTIDETSCGDPRMNFVKGGANAYLDLQRDRNVDVGIMTFNETPTLDRMIGTLNAGNIAAYKLIITNMLAGGNTGIGDALDSSTAEFTRVATIGRSRTAYLMTDGFNTSGVNPVDAAERLRDIGVRVHVLPAGSDVSETELGGVAATTGGDLFPAPGLNELTAIYAELAGRHRGAAMALPRVNFELSMRGGSAVESPNRVSARIPPRERSFPIYVERNAKSLVAFVSGRNARISDWSVEIELRGPGGELFGPGSPELTVNPYYLFLDVPNPAEGEWRLVTRATGPALQQATALAFIDNPEPDFFAGARPRIVSGADNVMITANPSYVSDLGSDGVAITGRIEGPTGFTSPVTMSRNITGAWSADAGPFPYTGFYRATLALDVGPTAKLAPGESIHPGPETPPITVHPFRRFASAGFIVINGKDQACRSGNRADCDGNGVPDKGECLKYGADVDGDGRPNGVDPDNDGDEIPDIVEGMRDLNQNRIPDMCEKNEPRTAPPPKDQSGDKCIPLRPKMIKPAQIGKSWRLTDQNVSLFEFGADAASARYALDVINRYQATHICYVGAQGRSFSYLLSNGKPPAGEMKGEKCTSFDPATLRIAEQNGRFLLVSNKETIRDFGSDKAEAEAALAAIRKYSFRYLCTVGSSKVAPFQYMRQ